MKNIYIYIIIISLLSCTRKIAPIVFNDSVRVDAIIKKIDIIRWKEYSDSDFDQPIFDTIVMRFDKVENLISEIYMYREDEVIKTDSISYQYTKSDTMPDWQLFNTIEGKYIKMCEGIHVFDSLGNVVEEHLIIEGEIEHKESKMHHFDVANRNIGYNEYYENGVLRRKVELTY